MADRKPTEARGAVGSAEPVAVEHVRAGDVVLLDDGTLAVIDSVRFGSYWLDSGRQEPAVALGWQAGTSSGVMFRRCSDILQRVGGQSLTPHLTSRDEMAQRRSGTLRRASAQPFEDCTKEASMSDQRSSQGSHL